MEQCIWRCRFQTSMHHPHLVDRHLGFHKMEVALPNLICPSAGFNGASAFGNANAAAGGAFGGGLVPRLDGLDVKDGDSVNFIVVLKCNSKLLHVLLILYRRFL